MTIKESIQVFNDAVSPPDNDRMVELTNDDDGKVVNVPFNDLDELGLISQLKTVEETTGKVVTGISLEMDNIRKGKPHNLGFSFE
jgi:hypothetical protein|tara:strand:- start:46 stop:300 length:255 start_codon:yes stop_codon:yes gene_type:complete